MSNREENFERMLDAVKENYRDTERKMDRLRQEGKEKSVTFRQLMGNKLMYQNMLSMYKLYGLLEEE